MYRLEKVKTRVPPWKSLFTSSGTETVQNVRWTLCPQQLSRAKPFKLKSLPSPWEVSTEISGNSVHGAETRRKWRGKERWKIYWAVSLAHGYLGLCYMNIHKFTIRTPSVWIIQLYINGWNNSASFLSVLGLRNSQIALWAQSLERNEHRP
jgi:hypothetical protein